MSKHHNLKLILWIILVLIVLVGIFCLGLVTGYSTLGKGDWHAVFEWTTWQHILDFWK